MTITQFSTRIYLWITRSLLPVRPIPTVPGTGTVDDLTEIFLRKIDEELREFKVEVRRPKRDLDCLYEEAADVMVTVIAALGAACCTKGDGVAIPTGLEMAIHKKLAVLEAGDWYYSPVLKVFKRRK